MQKQQDPYPAANRYSKNWMLSFLLDYHGTLPE